MILKMGKELEVTLGPSEVEKEILKRIKSVVVDDEYQVEIIAPIREKQEDE